MIQAAPVPGVFEVSVTTEDGACEQVNFINYRCPALTGIDLTVRVKNTATGLPVERGTIAFQRCLEPGGSAPSSSCVSGDGRWVRDRRLRRGVDETGAATVMVGAAAAGVVRGWTWTYLGQGSGVRNTDGPRLDIRTVAP